MGSSMIAAVSLGIWFITDLHAFNGTLIKFRIMSVHYQYEGLSSDLSEVGQVGFDASESFIQGDIGQGTRRGVNGEVACCIHKLIPTIWGKVTMYAHSACLIAQSLKHLFSVA